MDLEVIYSANDNGKLPKGCNNNKPLYRKKKIISTIIKYNNKSNDNIKLTQINSKTPLIKAITIHCPIFLNFLTNAYSEWLEYGVNRDINYFYQQEINFSQNENEIINCEDEIGFIPAQTAPRFDSLQRAGKNVHAQICYFGLDRFTPIFNDTRDTLESDLHVIEEAFNKLKNGNVKRIYALTTMPGFFYFYFFYFCLFFKFLNFLLMNHYDYFFYFFLYKF